MNYDVTTIDGSLDYAEKLSALSQQTWPEFLRHGDDYHWGELRKRFARFQLLFISGSDLIGVGHTVPLRWNNETDSLPDTIEEIILSAIKCHEQKQTPNTLAALAVMVSAPYRGKGLSTEILTAMKLLAKENHLKSLIVPVRPTLKSRYPITPFDQYVTWKRTDGSPFDPWLRVHWKLGASVLRIVPKAMTVEGTVEKWESWTDVRFPASGEYIVEGALQPIIIDHSNNAGRYEDPNLWMLHTI
ncbi:MAG: hypothetical protein ABIH23_10800 [bacterium]